MRRQSSGVGGCFDVLDSDRQGFWQVNQRARNVGVTLRNFEEESGGAAMNLNNMRPGGQCHQLGCVFCRIFHQMGVFVSKSCHKAGRNCIGAITLSVQPLIGITFMQCSNQPGLGETAATGGGVERQMFAGMLVFKQDKAHLADAEAFGRAGEDIDIDEDRQERFENIDLAIARR